MLKKLPKKSELNYSKNVLDIVRFGSSVIEGKLFNDIDIAVIFHKIPLKEQLDEAQNIKNQLQKQFDKPIHIKSYDLYSLFEEGNFAKESILFYGKSLISNRYFSEFFGITPKIQLNYSLSKLQKKDKVRFNYTLNGKGGNYGMLRKYSGKLLNPGLIEINPEHEEIFIRALSEISKEIKMDRIFLNVQNG